MILESDFNLHIVRMDYFIGILPYKCVKLMCFNVFISSGSSFRVKMHGVP